MANRRYRASGSALRDITGAGKNELPAACGARPPVERSVATPRLLFASAVWSGSFRRLFLP
jgi:hypothetical protein